MIRALAIVLLGVWSAAAGADELEFLFYRAPKPLNWSTPGSLARTTISNSFAKIRVNERNVAYPHSISHVNVKLRCGDEPAIFRGMTGTKSSLKYLTDLFFRGMSLDALLIPTPGRFYTETEIEPWLDVLKPQGYVRSLKIKLRPDQCGVLRDYIDDYKALGIDRIYGGVRSDPLIGQGAGCSAFAVSFLRTLGLDNPDFDAWKRTLKISETLLASRTRWASSGMLWYLAGWDSPWFKPGETPLEISFWDPELMFNWVGDVARGRTLSHETYAVSADSQTIEWDARGRETHATPFYPVPLTFVRDNANYYATHADTFLTDDEIRDPFYTECLRFRYCPRP